MLELFAPTYIAIVNGGPTLNISSISVAEPKPVLRTPRVNPRMCRRCWFLPTGGSRRAFHFSNFLTARPVLKWHSCRVKRGVKCHVPKNDQHILFRIKWDRHISQIKTAAQSLTLWVLCKNRRNQLENFAGPTPNRCDVASQGNTTVIPWASILQVSGTKNLGNG